MSHWTARAACRGADTEMFLSDSGTRQNWVIRTFCNRCAVRAECRDLADRTDPVRPYGVFGGTTAKQRQAERRTALRQAA